MPANIEHILFCQYKNIFRPNFRHLTFLNLKEYVVSHCFTNWIGNDCKLWSFFYIFFFLNFTYIFWYFLIFLTFFFFAKRLLNIKIFFLHILIKWSKYVCTYYFGFVWQENPFPIYNHLLSLKISIFKPPTKIKLFELIFDINR